MNTNTVNKPTTLTLAAFPFDNLSTNADDEIYCRSFSVELNTELSRIQHFEMIDPHSLQRIKSSSLDLLSELSKINSDYYILGSFRSQGDRFRVNVQMFNSQNKSLVWGDRFEGNREELFDLQDEILQKIVVSLQVGLNQDILSRIHHRKKTDLKAYEYWLYGLQEIEKGTLESDEKAREYFKQVLLIDQNSSLAYSGISLSYFNEWSCRLWDRWDVSRKGAFEYAKKALDLDETNYVALAVLGRCYLYLEEFQKAEHMLSKSLKINSNDSFTLIQIAFWFCYLNKASQAEDLYTKAIRLNPLQKERYHAYGSFIYFENGNYERSLELSLFVNPEKSWIDFYAFQAGIYFQLGQKQKAGETWYKYLKSFEKRIYDGTGKLAEEAYNWHRRVNPYKGHSKMEPLWEYIELKGDIQIPKQTLNSITPKASVTDRGETLEIHFANTSIIVKAAKGYYDIIKLLKEPEKEFHCTELIGSGLDDYSDEEQIDQKAKHEYQKRIRELTELLEESRELGDSKQVERLQNEYDSLVDYLAGALGLAGKSRKIGSSVEKARTAVTWRIRNAIKKLESIHPQLHRHLSQSVKTGTLCVYRPEQKIEWEF